MIASLAFVLGFLLMGIVVFFLALSGGPRAVRSQLQGQGRGGRRLATLATLVIMLGFGAGIPVAVIAANSDSQSRQAPGGIRLTADQQDGRKIFAHNCSTCHTLASANAVGTVGPNLDVLRPPKALVTNAVQVGRARGQGQMPANLVNGPDLTAVADYVAATAGHG